MNTPAILLVTDRDGVRGFVDVSADGWTPAHSETQIQLSDGGSVRVPTSLLTALDDTNYFLSCSIADLQHPNGSMVGPVVGSMLGTAVTELPAADAEDADAADTGVRSIPEVVVRSETVATVPVVAETLHVHKELRETGSVQVSKQVHVREEQVAVPLLREDLEIVRVPMHRVVDGPVPVRQEGDTTIYSVLEEVLVVEKRLVVREELHVRVRRSEHVETQSVQLRTEEVTVERTPAARPPPPPPPPSIKRGESS